VVTLDTATTTHVTKHGGATKAPARPTPPRPPPHHLTLVSHPGPRPGPGLGPSSDRAVALGCNSEPGQGARVLHPPPTSHQNASPDPASALAGKGARAPAGRARRYGQPRDLRPQVSAAHPVAQGGPNPSPHPRPHPPPSLSLSLTLSLSLSLSLTPTLPLTLTPWLKVGCNVLLSDVDVVYMRNPFQAQLLRVRVRVGARDGVRVSNPFHAQPSPPADTATPCPDTVPFIGTSPPTAPSPSISPSRCLLPSSTATPTSRR
jgi:hypothetical protein